MLSSWAGCKKRRTVQLPNGDGYRIKSRVGNHLFRRLRGVKEQCVMGKEQSCADCGCAIPAQYASLFDDTFRGESEAKPWIAKLLHLTA